MVSLVIPVYNGEKYLAECLHSVLANSLPPQQIIVVDDGSTDGTAGVAATFSQVIEYVRQPQAGASAARNLGIARASQELVAFQDADDLASPDRFLLQSRWLCAHPAVDGVFGEVEQFSHPAGAFPCDSRPQPAMLPGTGMFRHRLLRQVGDFDTGYQAAEFIDWALRAQECGARFDNLAKVVLRRRVHADNGGRQRPEARQDYARVVLSALLRRRERGPVLT